MLIGALEQNPAKDCAESRAFNPGFMGGASSRH
jgi:hypothetical protein